MIIDPPEDFRDVDGWNRCIKLLRERREKTDPDLYDMMMSMLLTGLDSATAPDPVIPPGSIRDRLARLKEEK